MIMPASLASTWTLTPKRAALLRRAAEGQLELNFAVPEGLRKLEVLTAKQVAVILGYARTVVEEEAEAGNLEYWSRDGRVVNRKRFTMRSVLLWRAERTNVTADDRREHLRRWLESQTAAALTDLIAMAGEIRRKKG